MAPEQIRGRPIDGGADLFALGVIAYEMLAGRRPWDGKDPRAVMTAVLKTLPPPVLKLHPSLMPRMEEVNRFLLRVLEKERQDRPREAVAFFDELQDALFGGADAARNALAGARPVSPIEDVTSRSIVIPSGAAQKQRFDETEIDPARRDHDEPPARDGSDTVRETALDTGSIPIFVAERLDSQYLPPLDVEDVRDDESGKSTLPRGTAQIPKKTFVSAPRRSYSSAIATTLIILILLTAAFLAGRYLKF